MPRHLPAIVEPSKAWATCPHPIARNRERPCHPFCSVKLSLFARRSSHMHKAGAQCREGRSLHAQLELVDRLCQADDSMAGAIEQARQKTAQMERQRIAAYQKREMADRLVGRAANDLATEQDRKLSEQPRAKPRKMKGTGL